MSPQLSLRLQTFFEWVSAHVEQRARVLEVGCGRGELAAALAGAGYDVTAIDPNAPDGPIFRRVTLEQFSADAPYDAVVASVSLHHVEALDLAFERLASLLRPGGTVVVEEFAKERFDGPTAMWYFHQRLALQALGANDRPVPADFTTWFELWAEEHADIHSSDELRAELGARFDERLLVWGPYLYDYRLHDAVEPLERELIATGSIEPTGFRYVGRA
jgi:SAM-dependent methyltransferase